MPSRHLPFVLAAVLLLPACENLIVTPPDSNRNMEDFQAAWQRVRDVYPYLEFKKVNWDSLYSVYLPRVESARGDEFYRIFGDMLGELKDGHLYYRMPGGGKVYPYVVPRHLKDRHAYSPFVVRKYFDRELRLSESKSIEYEIMSGNIGYVFLSDFHEDYLIEEFPGALEYLRNTKGLILDIRQKRGGGYDNVEAVVTRFISSPLHRPQLYFLGVLTDNLPFQPRGPFTYTNPVVVIINGSTFSAGELTAEILKQIPTVTVIGDTTGGGSVVSSDSPPEYKGEYRLPSGKIIYIGTGDIRRYDGIPWEGLGVAPDIRVPQTAADIEEGRDKQLEYAISVLR